MKKLLTVFVCLTLTTSMLFAQNEQTNKGGSQSSNVKEDIIKEILEKSYIDNDITKSLEVKKESQPENVSTEEPQNLVHFQTGTASFYGEKWNGRKTSNGEIFDTYKLTAAHKTLPFGTLVKVTNEKNGKSVVVRINDRGPFIKGRIIDLSKAAFEAIESVSKGITKVKLEIVKE